MIVSDTDREKAVIEYAAHVVNELLKFDTTGSQIVLALRAKGWRPPVPATLDPEGARAIEAMDDAWFKSEERFGTMPGVRRHAFNAGFRAASGSHHQEPSRDNLCAYCHCFGYHAIGCPTTRGHAQDRAAYDVSISGPILSTSEGRDNRVGTSEGLRERIRDEVSGIVVGSGYYAVSIGIDAAGEVADAVLAVLEGEKAEEFCLLCQRTGPINFECGHPDAHTPLATSTHDANGEPYDAEL